MFKSALKFWFQGLFVTYPSFASSCSVSDRPSAALGAFQALSREGPDLLPERRRVLRHRDAQRTPQALQVSASCSPPVSSKLAQQQRLLCLLAEKRASTFLFRNKMCPNMVYCCRKAETKTSCCSFIRSQELAFYFLPANYHINEFVK